jgi:hypothetical protein
MTTTRAQEVNKKLIVLASSTVDETIDHAEVSYYSPKGRSPASKGSGCWEACTKSVSLFFRKDKQEIVVAKQSRDLLAPHYRSISRSPV